MTLAKSIRDIDKLTNNTTVYITLKQKKTFKIDVFYPHKKIIIYKENSNDFIEECFEEVEFMTFKTLYESKL